MPRKTPASFAEAATTSLMMVGVLFVVMGVSVVFGLPLQRWGILPRTKIGLVGIVLSPLLHANLSHLLANAIPLFVLLVLLLSNSQYRPYQTLALIWGASGLGTWLIGRGEAIHLGASSIVFGLVAFLIVAGFRLRSWKSAIVAVLVAFLYGGIFYGLLPQAGPISWEGHLCGAAAGVWAANQIKA